MKEKDFVFSFELEPHKPYDDEHTAVREMVREQLNNLLNIVNIYYNGEKVRVNEFSFMNEPDKIIPIFKRILE